MLDFSHIPENGNADVQVFTGNSITYGENWATWQKPRGKNMCSILILGRGGNGGISAPGAAAAISGAGGGSSGAMALLVMPLHTLPNTLFLSLGAASTSVAPLSSISIYPATDNVLSIITVNGGNAGSNSSGATFGTGGNIATTPSIGMGIRHATIVLGGQAGTNGGGAQSAGGALALPTTGSIVTGGTGGGGADSAAATTGFAGGAFTIPAGADFPVHAGGVGGAAATTPPTKGNDGYKLPGKLYFYGGTGAGSTYNAATGAGLVQAPGGDGGYGCGGGGLAATLSGATALTSGGLGGSALAIITCW